MAYFLASLNWGEQVCRMVKMILFTYTHDKHTVWKLHYLSITQIFCEINLGDSRSAKSSILTHSQVLNFDF